jgi:hypothetical protein
MFQGFLVPRRDSGAFPVDAPEVASEEGATRCAALLQRLRPKHIFYHRQTVLITIHHRR